MHVSRKRRETRLFKGRVRYYACNVEVLDDGTPGGKAGRQVDMGSQVGG